MTCSPNLEIKSVYWQFCPNSNSKKLYRSSAVLSHSLKPIKQPLPLLELGISVVIPVSI